MSITNCRTSQEPKDEETLAGQSVGVREINQA
jgi:hypothetical protein